MYISAIFLACKRRREEKKNRHMCLGLRHAEIHRLIEQVSRHAVVSVSHWVKIQNESSLLQEDQLNVVQPIANIPSQEMRVNVVFLLPTTAI
jgi:hypothetical protein